MHLRTLIIMVVVLLFGGCSQNNPTTPTTDREANWNPWENPVAAPTDCQGAIPRIDPAPASGTEIKISNQTPLAELLPAGTMQLITVWEITNNSAEDIQWDWITVQSKCSYIWDIEYLYLYTDRDNEGALVRPYAVIGGTQNSEKKTHYINPGYKPLIPAEKRMHIYAYVTTNPIGTPYVENGDIVQLNIELPKEDISFTGIESGRDIREYGRLNLDGAEHKLFETCPIVLLSPSSPSGVLPLAPQTEVGRFRILATSYHGSDALAFDYANDNSIVVNFKGYINDLTGEPISITLWNKTTGAKLAGITVDWQGFPCTVDERVEFKFQHNSLVIPPGTYTDIAVCIDTLQWEDAGDSITVSLEDSSRENFRWSLTSSSKVFSTGDISFREDIRGNTLIRSM